MNKPKPTAKAASVATETFSKAEETVSGATQQTLTTPAAKVEPLTDKTNDMISQTKDSASAQK